MAQMERNVNLEEIDSDALFGIDALKHQTVFQKIVFLGSLGLGVIANVALPLIFKTPRIACIFIFLALIVIGVAVGCNYTQDMTYGKYVYYYFFKPVKTLPFESTEDVELIRKKGKELKAKEEEYLRRQRSADPEAQKKLLRKIGIFILVIVLVIGGALIYKSVKPKSMHHEAVLEEELDE